MTLSLRSLLVLGLGAALLVLAASRWLTRMESGNPRPGDGPPTSPPFERPKNALYADDFSKSALSGWTADRRGVWSVRRGMLRAQLPDEKQQRSFIRAGRRTWTNYALDVDVCMTRGVDKGAAVRVEDDEGVGVDLRGPGYNDILLQRGWSRLGQASVVNRNGEWHHLRIEARGSRLRVAVNGKTLIDADDARARARGRIALAAYTGGAGQCTVYYDNVVVTPLGPAGGAASRE